MDISGYRNSNTLFDMRDDTGANLGRHTRWNENYIYLQMSFLVDNYHINHMNFSMVWQKPFFFFQKKNGEDNSFFLSVILNDISLPNLK